MTAALLAAACAAVLWPGARTGLHRRLRAATGDAAGGVQRWPARLPLLTAAGAAGAAALVSTPLVALLAGGSAALAARAWASRRAGTAAETRLVALAEALGALAAELRAGRALEEAARGAAGACPDRECGAALVRAVRAPGAAGTGAGGPQARGDELSAELARLSAAVVLSSRTGCSLATVVTAVEDDLRTRLRQRRALLVATAGPRSSARLLTGLPVLGLAMGSGIGADPWQVLTATGTGQVLLVVGVLLEVAGIAWTGRLVRRLGR
ncbi:type II secretion system F family protein [Blastococcus saxobsidens]|uniref:Putative Flp pilus assembly protein TadB n=1 Tax=Blastococcus saxobsidens (strain DD2) TaxID=1146883 RepID=H6RPU8_BLASD|nr:pilus assembly protein TadB [Blastococcus saxobsidens]CCG01517.1 Putative Flp pilus assembly protein TadB [Blastococcus saxobsidens DD2]